MGPTVSLFPSIVTKPPRLAQFTRDYPEMLLDVTIDGGPLDLVAARNQWLQERRLFHRSGINIGGVSKGS